MLQKLTKPVNLVYLLTTVVIFLLSLVFASNYERIMIDQQFTTDIFTQGIIDVREAVQVANDILFYLFVIAIVGFVVLNILGNGYRKKLYKSNLIAGIVVPSIVIVFSVITIVFVIQNISTLAANIDDVTAYRGRYDLGAPSNTWNYITIVFIIIYIFVNVGYLVYTILKYVQQKKNVEEAATTDAN